MEATEDVRFMAVRLPAAGFTRDDALRVADDMDSLAEETEFAGVRELAEAVAARLRRLAAQAAERLATSE